MYLIYNVDLIHQFFYKKYIDYLTNLQLKFLYNKDQMKCYTYRSFYGTPAN